MARDQKSACGLLGVRVQGTEVGERGIWWKRSAARAGYPVITVPGGYAKNGVIAPGGYNTKGPQGITFVGTAYSEPTLIKLAYGYEQASRHRVAPVMF